MSAVVEVRTYKLRPGSGAAFHRTVGEESVPMLQRWGVDVVAFGPSLDDDDSYTLFGHTRASRSGSAATTRSTEATSGVTATARRSYPGSRATASSCFPRARCTFEMCRFGSRRGHGLPPTG